ncbi:MAG: tetratricopeptide repeat protein [Steroidobacteraceae bacterium]|nr:tetratricopeptide repeat protein [Steroidobacteraceae bacterium]MDW8259224.1 tetratricopeptide repeat protein [Gammaproteobacteria bacterium]
MIDDDFYNEQEQWERVKRFARENGPWILAGIAIGVGALVGWRWWNERLEQRAVAAAARYNEALDAFGRDDATRGVTIVDELRREYGDSPYADQGDLAVARAFVEAGQFDKAAERLRRVMTESDDRELRLVARHRLARVQLAQGKTAEALATLNAVDPGAFAARFHELRGDILYAQGDKSGALREYLAARNRETGPDSEATLDLPGLELKIADLRADGVAEPSQ